MRDSGGSGRYRIKNRVCCSNCVHDCKQNVIVESEGLMLSENGLYYEVADIEAITPFNPEYTGKYRIKTTAKKEILISQSLIKVFVCCDKFMPIRKKEDQP